MELTLMGFHTPGWLSSTIPFPPPFPFFLRLSFRILHVLLSFMDYPVIWILVSLYNAGRVDWTPLHSLARIVWVVSPAKIPFFSLSIESIFIRCPHLIMLFIWIILIEGRQFDWWRRGTGRAEPPDISSVLKFRPFMGFIRLANGKEHKPLLLIHFVFLLFLFFSILGFLLPACLLAYVYS